MHINRIGHGPDLVLIHGWSLNSAVWQPILPMLAETFTCHCVDLPGHGQTPWQEAGFQREHLLGQLKSTMPDKAIWLGWSLGGQLALAMAEQFPEHVQQLVMLAATPKFVADDTWTTAMPETTFQQFSSSLAQDQHETLARFITLQSKGAGQSSETRQALASAIMAYPTVPEALSAGLTLLNDLDQRAALSDLTMPIKFILGTRDNLIPISVANAISQLQPLAEISQVARAGHAPFISHPSLCYQEIKTFCHV